MLPTNPLDEWPEARKWLYMFQWLVNGIVTVAGAYFLIDGYALDDLPKWYVLAVGIGPVVWTYLGLTASHNVNTEPVPPPVEPVVEPLPPA